MGSNIGFEMSLIIDEAIRGRWARLMNYYRHHSYGSDFIQLYKLSISQYFVLMRKRQIRIAIKLAFLWLPSIFVNLYIIQ